MYTWQELYDMAKERLNPRVLTPFMEAGGVAAAILTDKGNAYVGVCIDTCCSLGMCAERNAIANMITNGESRIVKLVCVMGDGRVGSPCGACREMMMQLDRHSPEIEILTDLETLSTVMLGDLVPDWWGTERMNQEDV
jgi:cytidine deaminase